MSERILLPIQSILTVMDFTQITDEAGRDRFTRTTDGTCDFCEQSEGSVIYDREADVNRCDECYNDPETYEAP